MIIPIRKLTRNENDLANLLSSGKPCAFVGRITEVTFEHPFGENEYEPQIKVRDSKEKVEIVWLLPSFEPMDLSRPINDQPKNRFTRPFARLRDEINKLQGVPVIYSVCFSGTASDHDSLIGQLVDIRTGGVLRINPQRGRLGYSTSTYNAGYDFYNTFNIYFNNG
jgi:hypothetical protein